jgi:hypothetical protein
MPFQRSSSTSLASRWRPRPDRPALSAIRSSAIQPMLWRVSAYWPPGLPRPTTSFTMRRLPLAARRPTPASTTANGPGTVSGGAAAPWYRHAPEGLARSTDGKPRRAAAGRLDPPLARWTAHEPASCRHRPRSRRRPLAARRRPGPACRWPTGGPADVSPVGPSSRPGGRLLHPQGHPPAQLARRTSCSQPTRRANRCAAPPAAPPGAPLARGGTMTPQPRRTRSRGHSPCVTRQ